MTSQGSAYMRFKRALDRGNATIAWTAAAELDHVRLEDAIALCLLQLTGEQWRFDRAAVRLQARLCREVKGLGLAEAQLIGAALGALASPGRQAAALALAELFELHGEPGAAQVLERWARQDTNGS
jgi:hypothetical protein